MWAQHRFAIQGQSSTGVGAGGSGRQAGHQGQAGQQGQLLASLAKAHLMPRPVLCGGAVIALVAWGTETGATAGGEGARLKVAPGLMAWALAVGQALTAESPTLYTKAGSRMGMQAGGAEVEHVLDEFAGDAERAWLIATAVSESSQVKCPALEQ